MDQTCSRCGAPVTGLVCEYCGVLTTVLANPADEKKAVDEFHEILLTKDDTTRENMLKNGFLPTSIEGLLEAGVRCIPLVDANEPGDGVVISAAGRLQAIVTKIRLMPDFDRKQQAITEFEAVLQNRQNADRKVNTTLAFILVGSALLLVLCIAGGIFMMAG